MRETRLRKRESDGALRLNWGEAAGVRLVKAKVAPAKTAAEQEAFFRAQPSKPGEFRATWIHSAYGIEGWGWDKTIATLKSNGFNAIIPNLVWAGVAHYPSKILPVSPKVAEQGDQVAECLKACRKYGIEMHVWKVNHNLLHAPPEFVAKLRAAGRTQKDRQGRGRQLALSFPPRELRPGARLDAGGGAQLRRGRHSLRLHPLPERGRLLLRRLPRAVRGRQPGRRWSNGPRTC